MIRFINYEFTIFIEVGKIYIILGLKNSTNMYKRYVHAL